MPVTSYITGPTRRIAVGSTTSLLVALVVAACSSTTTLAPTSPATSTLMPASTGPAPTGIVMPDLVGMYWKDAQPKLGSLGWTGVIDKGPDIPAGPQHWNRIVTQSPASGEPLAADTRITLQFGV